MYVLYFFFFIIFPCSTSNSVLYHYLASLNVKKAVFQTKEPIENRYHLPIYIIPRRRRTCGFTTYENCKVASLLIKHESQQNKIPELRRVQSEKENILVNQLIKIDTMYVYNKFLSSCVMEQNRYYNLKSDCKWATKVSGDLKFQRLNEAWSLPFQ